jgi:Tfp pilus assembly protein PilZ
VSAERIRTALRTRFSVNGSRGAGNIVNLSEGGLFVRTRQLPRAGQAIRLAFAAPGVGRISISGLVWWTTADTPSGRFGPSGFGLRLLDEPEGYARLLQNLRH